MTDRGGDERQTQSEGRPSNRTRRRFALMVGLACAAVVSVVVAMNLDRLPVQSDESDSPGMPASPSANTPPVILDVAAASERIEPSDNCAVSCDAVDEDGDALTYHWETSQGNITGEGASVEWSAPDIEGLFRVSVTVDDGHGGTARHSISLRVKENYSPELSQLTASSGIVQPGSATYVSCEASDADGDEITYEWNATAGELYGQGDGIMWLAPDEPGPYWVTVYARDAYGGQSTRAIVINVTATAAPDLGRFRVKGVNTDLVQFDDGVWDVFMGRSVSIRCVVIEGEQPFTYEWSVDYGELVADGDTAVWEAPEEQGPATVLVDVTDVHGGTTRGTVLLYAETCTCAFN